MVHLASISAVLRQGVCLQNAHYVLLVRASSSLSNHGSVSALPVISTGHNPRKNMHFMKSRNANHLNSMVTLFHTGDQYAVDRTVKRPNIEKKVQENLEKMRKGEYENMAHPDDLSHFRKPSVKSPSESVDTKRKEPPIGTHALPHPIWSDEEVQTVEITHKQPQNIVDRLALLSVKTLRFVFDLVSGYSWRKRTEKIWLTRIIFLETVAGVPGMVGAMTRHFHSLRRLRRDHGWIHTLLEEAENERMHLMTALQVRKPGLLFRAAVVVSQGLFVNGFFLAYLVSPRFCHRFVGYLEEEAVCTYTKCLQDIESGHIQHWKTQPAPQIAITYWKLAPEATMRDVILAIRADEAHHRVVNHTLGSMKPDDYNPYKPGK